jgi:hypothetical protein
VNEAHQRRVASRLLVELQARIDSRNSSVLDRLENIGEHTGRGATPDQTTETSSKARRADEYAEGETVHGSKVSPMGATS